MDTKVCYLFGAGEQSPCHIELGKDDLVIAVDGGFNYLEKIGLRADYVLGDFDSVSVSSHLPSDCIRHPKEKDDTDMMLAARLGLEKGYTNFEIYGGLGGRLDHTLANIQTLTFLNRHNAVGTLIGDGYALKVVTNGVISFGKDLPENTAGNTCSVFSLSDVSTNVTIQGFHYEVEGATLTNSFPLGVSNEFTGRKGSISVSNGTLAVLWNRP